MAELNSMIDSMIPLISSYSKHINRKCTLEAKIRNLFYHCRNTVRIPPKKEYLRCRLIRGHKRINRQLCMRGFPIGILNNFDLSYESAKSIWEQLEKIYLENKQEMDDTSKTESGPKTDGISKRKVKTKNLEKSFNLTFCQRYFKSSAVLKSFYYYVDLVFYKLDAELLCKKFDFRCCEGNHLPECIEKWLILKQYIRVMMIEELDIEPLKHSNYMIPNYFAETVASDFESNYNYFEKVEIGSQNAQINLKNMVTDISIEQQAAVKDN